MVFNPVYVLILFYTIAVDYIAGLKIEKNHNNLRVKKYWLWASLVANIGALAFFKYADFILESLNGIFYLTHTEHSFSLLNILLPIGLSFHTFQAISYTVEVYRGKQQAERNLIDYSLYVMFFPQLVAGPIERPQRLLHQFKEKHVFKYENFSIGAKWILWGLFKKIVVADNLAIIVDAVYASPQQYNGLALICATILFAFQIYGDFSGYSDIAKGTAKILGFDLMINFNLPYFSKNVSEFWRKWHISLSTWFKDYVYIPLGGNQTKGFKNTLLTFALSGLWHGANITFLIWGLLNGLMVYADKYIFKRTYNFHSWLKIGLTFIGIDFCWIVFRASNIGDAWYIITHLFADWSVNSILAIGVDRHIWAIAISMLMFMIGVEWMSRHKSLIETWHNSKRIYKVMFLNLLLLFMLFFGVFEHRTFIYFQF